MFHLFKSSALFAEVQASFQKTGLSKHTIVHLLTVTTVFFTKAKVMSNKKKECSCFWRPLYGNR